MAFTFNRALLIFLAVSSGGAFAQTRALHIKHAHTGEEERVIFKTGNNYDAAGLKKLNWMLRDWRNDEPRVMDPELFDVVFELYRATGASEPINVVSAYRSEGTNAMLRRRSRGVARNSQHIQGKALDFHIPGVSSIAIREAALKLERGGVGFYPRAGTAFIHVDTGSVRHWPKMSRDQLAKVFPDGKTVHIPRDGKPMAGFDVALASLNRRGGTFSRILATRGGDEVEDLRSTGSGDGGRLMAFLRGRNTIQATPSIVVAAKPPTVDLDDDENNDNITPKATAKPTAVTPVKPIVIASFMAPLPLQPPREREMMRSKITNLDKTGSISMAAPLPRPREESPLPFKTAVQANSALITMAPLPQSDPRVNVKMVAQPVKLVEEAKLKTAANKMSEKKEVVKMIPTSFGKQLQVLSSASLSGDAATGFKR